MGKSGREWSFAWWAMRYSGTVARKLSFVIISSFRLNDPQSDIAKKKENPSGLIVFAVGRDFREQEFGYAQLTSYD